MKNTANKVASGSAGPAYFMAFIGALVYYVQQSEGFWELVLAFLKACVWPAFLTYDLLKFIS